VSNLPYKLTIEEVPEYLERLYGRLLENRYRYYILDAAVLDDWVYDELEKTYNELVAEYGGKPMDMVDFDLEDELAIAAKNRVDAGEDCHSLWEKEMQPVWDKLGKSRKEKNKIEAKEVE